MFAYTSAGTYTNILTTSIKLSNIKAAVFGVAEFIGYVGGYSHLRIDNALIDINDINGTYVIGVTNSSYYNSDLNIIRTSVKLVDITNSN